MNLEELRNQIDKIDARILELLNKRTEAAVEIGRIKLKKKKKYYVPGREKEICQRLLKKNKGPLSDELVKGIYQQIMSASLSLQQEIFSKHKEKGTKKQRHKGTEAQRHRGIKK
ncbi:MAG: P-protein [Syntrophomonadaceae bacterium]|nr:P-protein [Bacillota bacterium]